MKVMIDLNVILDVLCRRDKYIQDSSLVWKLCETETIVGYVSTLSFANLVYILRKELVPEQVEETIRKLSLIFEFADLTQEDILRAASLKWNDFEDAIQAVIAERLHTDFIITRNVRDFKNSTVQAIFPSELIARL